MVCASMLHTGLISFDFSVLKTICQGLVKLSSIFDHSSAVASMTGGRFHQQLKDMFAPLVVRYVDLMEIR